jgi:hypothetical protein
MSGSLLVRSVAVSAEDSSWPRFHGPDGDNHSPDTGLLKKWPDAGPKLLWTAKAIGHGFAGVTTADGRVYTAGEQECLRRAGMVTCANHAAPTASGV